MKRLFIPSLVAGCIAILAVGSASYSADAPAKKAAPKAASSRYLVIVPHTPEECLQALDQISAQGPAVLNRFEFGCKAGDHTAYAMVVAGSDEQAMKVVPEPMREKARVVKLNKFSQKEIKAFHEQMGHDHAGQESKAQDQATQEQKPAAQATQEQKPADQGSQEQKAPEQTGQDQTGK